MEELFEDNIYIIHKTGLSNKIKAEDHSNPSMTKGGKLESLNREVFFWQDVSIPTIKSLYKHYRIDMDMFDYGRPNDYFRKLGLTQKVL